MTPQTRYIFTLIWTKTGETRTLFIGRIIFQINLDCYFYAFRSQLLINNSTWFKTTFKTIPFTLSKQLPGYYYQCRYKTIQN